VTALLELVGLEVSYGPVAAVRGLTLSVEHGEAVGLIGPNGAGKTSTLHAIMGAAEVSGGEVRLRGRPLRGMAPEAIARAGVALVPEGRRVFASLTVEENLRLGAAARRARTGLDQELRELSELFPVLSEARRRRAGALSGGQQQQLAIARGLIARPDVLLLDEPSLGLSPLLVDQLFEVLGRVRESGVSILLSEQRAQHTVAFADRTHVISNGVQRALLGPADAGDTQRMIAAYLAAS
jgi:branched-chain amino acid transport system ATP-binding protein